MGPRRGCVSQTSEHAGIGLAERVGPLLLDGLMSCTSKGRINGQIGMQGDKLLLSFKQYNIFVWRRRVNPVYFLMLVACEMGLLARFA